MLSQIPLDQVLGLVSGEPEQNMNPVHVARIQSDRVRRLSVHILKLQKIVRKLWWPGHLRCSVQAQYQQVQDQPIILHNKRGKLQAPYNTIRIRVVHVLVIDDDIILGAHVVGDVMVHNESQQTI